MATSDVKTARRTLDLLEAFYREKGPMTLTELARAVAAPLSSCHGIVHTMISRGYLYSVDGSRRIYPTKRLMRVAQTIAENDPLLRLVLPSLVRLRDDSGETVIIGKRQGDLAVYLEVVEGTQTIRYTAQPGQFKPLYCTSIGKALLASLSEGEFALWLERHPLSPITANTITDGDMLRRELAAGRARGFHISPGENVVDSMGISVAVRLGDEVFGICIAGPLQRMQAQLSAHSRRLLSMREQLLEGIAPN